MIDIYNDGYKPARHSNNSEGIARLEKLEHKIDSILKILNDASKVTSDDDGNPPPTSPDSYGYGFDGIDTNYYLYDDTALMAERI